ncbi:MAG TPA: YdcF family protein [Candidatus Nanopelagicales bacterium]|nr:YdcF family protein [Candidatus Nanopelagicales bacterium]
MAVSTETETPAAPARRRSPVRRVLAALLALVVLLAAGLTAFAAYLVVSTSRSDDATPTDAIIVLGAAQFWGKPSPVLQARLQHAADLYADGVSDHVITVGAKQPGDNTTEADAGRGWLTSHGVPASSVVPVPEGHDTLVSLEAAAVLMAERGWTSATIVTDPAHMARSVAMARALGIDAHASPTTAGAGSSVTAEYVARETLGLLSFWLTQRRDVHARL